jgi:hypothetical protein
MSPELTVILINFIILIITYFFIFPKFAKKDLNKISLNDLIASSIALFVVGSIFWGTGISFNAILFKLNWFWFSLFTYLIMEIPFVFWYLHKNKIDLFK